MFTPRACNQKGALLIEVLLTVTIVGVVSTYIVRSHIASLRALKYSQEYALAVLLLENKMNKILKKGFIARDVIQKDSFQDPHDFFSYELRTKKPEAQPRFQDLNQVDLLVSWPSGGGSREISARMLLFHVP